ncbi:uncharacterized protein N7484_002765 [Penicillium longicatenatum]|uniref:uncharacterized protein n=1 Tax=Penicillium longicatenatum TaxID=1561947 RepID=UPI002548EE58|nr:uncharacterized protein N7484_002765 [Penicillium longicatenatum]KAJ5649042.1 hypothetical protein N7484_002765 [Penicillium longicatenatum]
MAKKMFQLASVRAEPSYRLPNSPFSPRRRDSGSRIPRPKPTVAVRLDESALDALENSDISDISDTSILELPNSDERPLFITAIPMHARRDRKTKRLPLDNQASVQAASVRLVNISRGNSQASTVDSTRNTSHGSHTSPTELSTISEKSKCSTTTSSDYHSFIQTDGPLLRLSLSADRIIMGDESRSMSLPNITDERRSRGIFRPQIIQHIDSLNDTPSDITSKPSEGKMEPQHGPYHNPFFPEGTVDASPNPSMECLNGDPIKHGSISKKINDRTECGTAYSIPAFPPRTSSLNALSSLNSSPEKKEAWSKISTVNSGGKVEASDNELIGLYGLLADFDSRDLRIGEAASLVAQMRAEASLRRYAMMQQVHQISQDHDAFSAAELPSDRIVEDWAHTSR